MDDDTRCLAKCADCGWTSQVNGFEAAADVLDAHYLTHHDSKED